MPTMLWLQAGSCGGDSFSLLGAEDPDFLHLLEAEGIELLWHPSLSCEPLRVLHRRIDAILAGELTLDILCVEGSIMTGPAGTGMYDRFRQGQGKHQVIAALADKARHVVAMGTCAAFGGIPAAAPNPADCVGLQFVRAERGGLLPPEWRARGGLPVVNVAGCPAHPAAIVGTLSFLAAGLPLELDDCNRPLPWFGTTVHSGCTRNEYHEYDVEDNLLGGDACMFFNLGCKGPMTRAVCNTALWQGRGSKTRVGVPCFGCTASDFPAEGNLFATPKLGNIPLRLPEGVNRASYMAYKQLAQRAAPVRLTRKTGKD